MSVCEHCRINIMVYGLYGKFRTYVCARGIKIGELLAGSDTPCKGHHQPSCYSSIDGKRHSPLPGKFRYKMIPFSEMKKSEDCLKEEKREKEEKKVEATRMRYEAEDLLIKARKLEKEVEE